MPQKGDNAVLYPDDGVGISKSSPLSGDEAVIHGDNISRGESNPVVGDDALLLSERLAQSVSRADYRLQVLELRGTTNWNDNIADILGPPFKLNKVGYSSEMGGDDQNSRTVSHPDGDWIGYVYDAGTSEPSIIFYDPDDPLQKSDFNSVSDLQSAAIATFGADTDPGPTSDRGRWAARSGDYILSAQYDPDEVWVIDTTTWTVENTLTEPTNHYADFCGTGGDYWVLVDQTPNPNEINIYDATTLPNFTHLNNYTLNETVQDVGIGVDISPNGSLVAVHDSEQGVLVLDRATGNKVAYPLEGVGSGYGYSVRFTHNGNFLAWAVYDFNQNPPINDAQVAWVEVGNWSNITYAPFAQSDVPLNNIRWSPDDEYITGGFFANESGIIRRSDGQLVYTTGYDSAEWTTAEWV